MVLFNRQKFVRSTHRLNSALVPSVSDYEHDIRRYVEGAFESDLGQHGDVTSSRLMSPRLRGKARIVSQSKGVFAGRQEVHYFLSNISKRLSGSLRFKFLSHDGDTIVPGTVVLEFSGSAIDILAVERTVLNVLQRMSGVASLTREYVRHISSKVLLLPTRKTLWGQLDKRACYLGGAGTHRLTLSDAVLVKDNHLALLGDHFSVLLEKLFSIKRPIRFVEIEVTSFHQAKDLLTAFDSFTKKSFQLKTTPRLFILLDNMKPADIRKVIVFSKRLSSYQSVFFEASGGINLDNVSLYSSTGVDMISVGALTHSARSLDLSLEIEPLTH